VAELGHPPAVMPLHNLFELITDQVVEPRGHCCASFTCDLAEVNTTKDKSPPSSCRVIGRRRD